MTDFDDDFVMITLYFTQLMKNKQNIHQQPSLDYAHHQYFTCKYTPQYTAATETYNALPLRRTLTALAASTTFGATAIGGR
jgi:hypothetical protein